MLYILRQRCHWVKNGTRRGFCAACLCFLSETQWSCGSPWSSYVDLWPACRRLRPRILAKISTSLPAGPSLRPGVGSCGTSSISRGWWTVRRRRRRGCWTEIPSIRCLKRGQDPTVTVVVVGQEVDRGDNGKFRFWDCLSWVRDMGWGPRGKVSWQRLNLPCNILTGEDCCWDTRWSCLRMIPRWVDDIELIVPSVCHLCSAGNVDLTKSSKLCATLKRS